MIACLRAAVYGGKSIITEHGIYLQEREMELLKSNWLDDPYLKDMWIDSFSAICRWQYKFCDRIITLFEGNRDLEVAYGASRDRILVIPNGIDIARFREARKSRCDGSEKRIGFVGRVTRVKDVKTFIQAMAVIIKSCPKAMGLIIGPMDEEPDYYKECLELIKLLDIKENIVFTGRANVLDYYKVIDILLLTSIKEAMPLVVMEAMACGIPVISTDVGACRELLYGNNDGFGEAGIVRRIMDSEGIANAALTILNNRDIANRYGQNGIKTVSYTHLTLPTKA